MAGHSQFKNIMHRKGAQDAKRAKIFTKLLREITVAVRTSGSDVATNPRLRHALFQCRQSNVPKDTIDRAISKASESTENYESTDYFGRGPGNTALVIRVLSDNKNRSACEIRTALGRHGGELADVGFLFQYVGILDYHQANIDAIIDFSIKNTVLDVQEYVWGIRVISDRESFLNLRESMENVFGPANQASLCWHATTAHSLDEEKKISIMKLIHALEDLDDVQMVWTNADDDLKSLRQELDL